jgi:hypothetical protein
MRVLVRSTYVVCPLDTRFEFSQPKVNLDAEYDGPEFLSAGPLLRLCAGRQWREVSPDHAERGELLYEDISALLDIGFSRHTRAPMYPLGYLIAPSVTPDLNFEHRERGQAGKLGAIFPAKYRRLFDLDALRND